MESSKKVDKRMKELEEYKDLFKDCNVVIPKKDMNLSEVG